MTDLESLKQRFEHYLLGTESKNDPENLYDPIAYLLSIGGKRIRPVLLLAVYALHDDQIDFALPAAAAVELFHNFSLMHDDIMDDANLRRGKETVHEKYNANQAILSGDAMLIQSYQKLEHYQDQKYYPELIKFFSQTSLGICEGQQMDMDFETRAHVEIQEYIKMIELKTAILFGASMKIGGMLSGLSAADTNHLYEFGKNLGIAFQLLDDYLDCYGEKAKVGKKLGGDIIQSKKTYLHLKTMELATDKEKVAYLKVFNSEDLPEEQKVDQVLQFYRDVNAAGYLQELKDVYTQLAISHINATSIDQQKFEGLKTYLLNLAKRTY